MSGLFSSSKPKDSAPSAPPQVNPSPSSASPDAESLRRAGRASLLLSTSSQGVLGKPQTGRAQLLAA